MKPQEETSFSSTVARFAYALIRPVEPFGDYYERLGASTRSSAPVLPSCR
jgi:hypothetical protein